jgi:hypothetical protein
MREMFRQVFSTITTLFGAIERGATAIDNYASWAEAESAAFAAESAIERSKRLTLLKAQA